MKSLPAEVTATLPRRPSLTVVYPLDPMGPKIGGSVSFIRGLLQHAPAQFALRFIGISSDPISRPPQQWTVGEVGGRCFEFFPVLLEAREDQRRLVPLSLRFVLRLRACMLPDSRTVLIHNRPETVLASGMNKHHNLVFIHNDVPSQVGAGPTEVLWSRVPWLYHCMERRVFARSDRVYTVSTNTLKDCQQRHPQATDKFAFVPTWVDSGRFSPTQRPKPVLKAELIARGLNANALAPWILYVGRLQPQKAPLRIIDAFALLRQRQPTAQLIVIGDGNLRAVFAQAVSRRNLSACVHLLGVVEQAALPAYYRAANVLLLASDFEGMPMCVLEALACGLPVASTRVGEVPRVVLPGTTGELAQTLSAEGVANAVGRVLEQPAAYHPAACLAAVQQFSPQRVLAPIYARIAELNQRHGAAR